MTAGTNHPETTSASFWIGARLRWASATSATMRASSVSAPTFSARMTSAPVPLTVAPMTRSPAAFSTGIGSPVTIDSSTLRALEHHPVHRHLLARPECAGGRRPGPPPAARPPLVPSGLHPPGGSAPAQQLLDGGAGPAARPQLQHLAQQDERDDDRGRLEVDRDLAPMRAKRRRKDAGASNGHHAVTNRPRSRPADEVNMLRRGSRDATASPARRTARPPTDTPASPAPAPARCARHGCDIEPAERAGPAACHPSRHDEQGHRERRGHPEAAGHVVIARGCRRWPCAARAPCRRSGSCPAVAHDLRMHRAHGGPRRVEVSSQHGLVTSAP
jgi:hypothetical protein